MRSYKSPYHLLKRRIIWWFSNCADGREEVTIHHILYEAEKSRKYASDHTIEGMEIDGGTDILLTYCLEIDDSALWDRLTDNALTKEEYQNYLDWLVSVGATFPYTLEECNIYLAEYMDEDMEDIPVM